MGDHYMLGNRLWRGDHYMLGKRKRGGGAMEGGPLHARKKETGGYRWVTITC